MKRKKATATKVVKSKGTIDISMLEPENGISVSPRSSGDVALMYDVLDKLQVGQSYKMPIEMTKTFTNARVTHKRTTNKIFIFRKLDSYNIRCWRLADGTQLVRRSTKKKK